MMSDWIIPDWPAPAKIKAVSTTRNGGVSGPPWNSLNLGTHVEDQAEHVHRNRAILTEQAGLQASPLWLEQIHSADVLDAKDYVAPAQADAMVARAADQVCVVMTADCLPVLFADINGKVVAAAHAGWRGLHSGVLEKTLVAMDCPVDQVIAWLGPAIGPDAFEVGEEVREAFVASHHQAETAFRSTGEQGKWLADIYALARLRLKQAGITGIYGGGECTVTDSTRFFSYRRDGVTGRMASLIWMESAG